MQLQLQGLLHHSSLIPLLLALLMTRFYGGVSATPCITTIIVLLVFLMLINTT